MVAHGPRALGQQDGGIVAFGDCDQHGGISSTIEIGEAGIGQQIVEMARMALRE